MPLNSGVDITVANTQTDVFTNALTTEFTLNFQLLNRGGGDTQVDVWLVKSGGSAGNANKIEHQRPLKGKGGIYERWAITWGPNDTIVALAKATGVNFVSWGAA